MSNEAIELYKSYINAKDPDLVFTDRFFLRKASNKSTHWSQNFLREAATTDPETDETKKDDEDSTTKPVKHSNDVNDDIGVKIPRYDPCLIRVVDELGEKVNIDHSYLKVVEIEDNIDWIIQEYDGYEWISHNNKILTYYPLYNDTPIRGKGTQSQELYEPNKENGFKDDTPNENTNPCFIQ